MRTRLGSLTALRTARQSTWAMRKSYQAYRCSQSLDINVSAYWITGWERLFHKPPRFSRPLIQWGQDICNRAPTIIRIASLGMFHEFSQAQKFAPKQGESGAIFTVVQPDEPRDSNPAGPIKLRGSELPFGGQSPGRVGRMIQHLTKMTISRRQGQMFIHHIRRVDRPPVVFVPD